jgi:large subunit ribosomal protein L24
MQRMTVKKGDQVQVIAGRDKGKRGTVEQVFPQTQKVIVSGINIVKRHLKPSRVQPRGGIVEKPAPLHRSKVMPICPETSKPTRVRYVTAENGTKYRSSQYGDISLDSK